MTRPRISIGRSMALIAVLAVGLAALARPTKLGSALVFSTTVATLTLATARAMSRPGPRRDFWASFAVGGWVYFALAFVLYSPGSFDDRRGMLATTALLDAIYPMLGIEAPPAVAPMVPPRAGPMPVPLPPPVTPMATFSSFSETWLTVDRSFNLLEGLRGPTTYYNIGHCLFAILSAVAVALMCRLVPREKADER